MRIGHSLIICFMPRNVCWEPWVLFSISLSSVVGWLHCLLASLPFAALAFASLGKKILLWGFFVCVGFFVWLALLLLYPKGISKIHQLCLLWEKPKCRGWKPTGFPSAPLLAAVWAPLPLPRDKGTRPILFSQPCGQPEYFLFPGDFWVSFCSAVCGCVYGSGG